MSREAKGSVVGRPPKEIDWKLVDQLLMAGCPGTEIAPHFDIHPDTLYQKVEDKFGCNFSAYYQEKKECGKSKLRLKQYEKALKEDGDPTMLIWLGKIRLDQRETDDVPTSYPNEAKMISDLEKIKLQAESLEKDIKIKELEKRLNEFISKADPVVSPSDQAL